MKATLEDVMSDFYNSLKLRMRDTLPWRKDNSVPLARVKGTNALGLNREMERLERFVAERIGKLKEALKAGEAIVLEETRQAEQLAGSLKADNAVLKAKLKEAEEDIEKKDLSSQKMEETLSAKIKTLENDIEKKDETLASQDNEIKDYKSKIEEAASRAKRAQDLAEKSQEKITGLEAQLKKTEELDHQKASTIKELEQQLAAKVQEFESMLKGKQELLTRRDSEIADLRSQLKRLTKGIGEMSSFFRQAEVLTGIEEQGVSTAAQNEPMYGVEEKPSAVETNIANVTPVVSDGLAEVVSPEIFQRIISELAQATNVISPLASLIVHEQAKALGESVEKFPRARLPELLEALAKEVSNENLQIDFRQRLADSAQITLN
jgi:DNA repair exonuclease SbcCD ATPase subunit